MRFCTCVFKSRYNRTSGDLLYNRALVRRPVTNLLLHLGIGRIRQVARAGGSYSATLTEDRTPSSCNGN